MTFNIKKTGLSDKIKPLDDQHQIDDSNIFGKKNFIYLCVGKKGSGKTSLILNLFNTPFKEGGFMKRFDRIFLISPTARNDSKMDELVEELEKGGTYYDDISNSVVEEVLEKVEMFNDSSKKKRKECLIWFDDCIHNLPSNRKRNQAFNKLMTANRHFKCSVIISSQRLNELNALVRSQADIVSYFRSDNKKEDDIFMNDYNVDKDMLKYVLEEPHSFITVSYMFGKPRIYKKFDEIEL